MTSGPAANAGMYGGVTVVKTMIELLWSYQDSQASVLMSSSKESAKE